jgi:hypothetical protein
VNSARAFFRAIRGPILLITLGSLFAIDHFGPYSFTRTWPVLLIVAGAMCLFERMTPDVEGPGVRPGGAV